MNITLIWMLFFSIVFVLFSVSIFYRPYRNTAFALKMGGIFAVVYVTITLVGFYSSIYSKTADTEIINGQVTGKTRNHGHYLRPYECNCTYTPRVCTSRPDGSSSCSGGDRVCQTCYEDRYTVRWDAQTTVGEFLIDSLDWSSSSVYAEPDPVDFKKIFVGEPVAKEHTYTNYIQAVPESLFTSSSEDAVKRFSHLIEPYPSRIFNRWYIDRVVTPGLKIKDENLFNSQLAEVLRTLGPKKEVNIVLVFANTSDPSYEYALRDAWENGNKNDVIVVFGVTNYPKIDFVRIISWTKNEIFKIKLQEYLENDGFVRKNVVEIISKHVDDNFVRREMKEFEYLQHEISPPTCVIVLVVVLHGLFLLSAMLFITPR